MSKNPNKKGFSPAQNHRREIGMNHSNNDPKAQIFLEPKRKKSNQKRNTLICAGLAIGTIVLVGYFLATDKSNRFTKIPGNPNLQGRQFKPRKEKTRFNGAIKQDTPPRPKLKKLVEDLTSKDVPPKAKKAIVDELTSPASDHEMIAAGLLKARAINQKHHPEDPDIIHTTTSNINSVTQHEMDGQANIKPKKEMVGSHSIRYFQGKATLTLVTDSEGNLKNPETTRHEGVHLTVGVGKPPVDLDISTCGYGPNPKESCYAAEQKLINQAFGTEAQDKTVQEEYRAFSSRMNDKIKTIKTIETITDPISARGVKSYLEDIGKAYINSIDGTGRPANYLFPSHFAGDCQDAQQKACDAIEHNQPPQAKDLQILGKCATGKHFLTHYDITEETPSIRQAHEILAHNLGDTPHNLVKSLDPEFAEYLSATRETIISNALNGLSAEDRRLYDEIVQEGNTASPVTEVTEAKTKPSSLRGASQI